MKASEVAAKAAALLDGDREATHGDKRVNHENIAAFWNAYLFRRPDRDAPLRGSEVAIMMNLLKMARTLAGAHNPDDFVDGVGYSAIAGELASAEAAL